MKIQLPDWLYDIFKWICIVVSPAAVTLLKILTEAWHWQIPVDAICVTITAITTFIGIILGISTISYNKENK